MDFAAHSPSILVYSESTPYTWDAATDWPLLFLVASCLQPCFLLDPVDYQTCTSFKLSTATVASIAAADSKEQKKD